MNQENSPYVWRDIFFYNSYHEKTDKGTAMTFEGIPLNQEDTGDAAVIAELTKDSL